MKYKLFCSIAVTLMSSNGLANEAQIEADYPVGEKFQTLDGINALNKNPNAPDMLVDKGFGSGSYYLFVTPSSGSANYSTLDYTYGGGGCMYTNSSHTDGDFDINIQIPDGHTIQGFRYYWNDTDANATNARLWQFNGAGNVTGLLNIDSTGDTGYGSFYAGLTGGNHVVDNTNGSYVIRFTGSATGAAQEVCGVRLFMSAP